LLRRIRKGQFNLGYGVAQRHLLPEIRWRQRTSPRHPLVSSSNTSSCPAIRHRSA
jgi:hypothetical protein